MKSVFYRLYFGMFSGILLTGLLITILVQEINQYRLQLYTESIAGGTVRLLVEGVSRHQEDDQDIWLSLASRIMGVDLNIIPYPELVNRGVSVEQLEAQQQLTIVGNFGNEIEVFALLPNQKALTFRIKEVADSQAKLTAFLILNDIGRFNQAERLIRFKELQAFFPFPVNLIGRTDIKLAEDIKTQLIRGEIAIEARKTNGPAADSVFIYAPFGRTNQLLVIGPVKLFQWFPIWLVFTCLIATLGLVGLITFLLIRPVERKLKHVDNVVTSIAMGHLEARASLRPSDPIGLLAHNINQMAQKISSLLRGQRELLEAISHEYKTPLARVKFRMERFRNNPDTAERAEQVLKDIDELDNLTKEILSLMSLNDIKGQAELIDIWPTIDQLVSKTRDNFPDNRIIHTTKRQYARTRVLGFPSHLTRALSNLMQNACRYGSGVVHIRFEQNSLYNCISIQDNGEGIPEKNRIQVFQPFNRLEKSRNKHTGGHGLGLAIVDRIVKMHGGTIEITEGELGGAKFTLNWPRVFSASSEQL